MSKIVILGGTGYTGRLIARRLLQYSEVYAVIAARNIEKSRAFAAELNQEFAGERAARPGLWMMGILPSRSVC